MSYLLRRAGHSFLVLAVMSFVIYSLMGLMPGDPIDLMISADPRITPADVERLRALYGLDLPIWQRYLNWLQLSLSGDFGHSRLYAKPVFEVLGPALLNTLQLLGLALSLSLLIALPLGILAAARQRSWFDYTLNFLAFGGISLPPFWLGLLLMMLFSVILGWLPAGGVAESGSSALESLRHMILPAATLAIASIGGYSRYVRAAMIEVLRQDYIRTARAKGLHPRVILWKHALRNALIPVVTIVALDLGMLFSGALVTETVFAWPGMGKLIFEAIMGNDYNLALIALLFATALTLGGNLLADLVYSWLDPRINLQRGQR